MQGTKKGSCLRAVRRFFEGSNRYARDGEWTVAIGGYDLWWEISYASRPVIDCVDGIVEALDPEFSTYAEKIVEKLNYKDRFGQDIFTLATI